VRLGQVSLPVIAHLSDGHYVVLHEVAPGGVVVGDPATGIVTWSLEQLRRCYSGALLLFDQTQPSCRIGRKHQQPNGPGQARRAAPTLACTAASATPCASTPTDRPRAATQSRAGSCRAQALRSGTGGLAPAASNAGIGFPILLPDPSLFPSRKNP
jgi:hypothetical protein